MEVFISYSHKDKVYLERLHAHLAVLYRDGQIEEWFDREILAGAKIDTEIAERLETSKLFLLLVSPDFLASDYCVEMEMKRILERHDLGEARVIPIIVEPCDWMATPLRNLKVLPNDGKPVSDWTNENNAYLNVVEELRRVLEAENTSSVTKQGNVPIEESTVHSKVRRYRLKRDFDEIDRSDFREKTFSVMRDYFERAVAEIDALEDLRGRFVLLSPVSFTCSIVNKLRENGAAHITVSRRNKNMGLGDISYSFTENAFPNMANGMFTIEADEFQLYLRSMIGLTGNPERLTPEAATERLWEKFLEQAGVISDSI